MYKAPILWIGNYEGSTGYSTAATGAVLALHAAGYDVVPLPSANTQLYPQSPVSKFYKHVEGKRMSILHETPLPGKTANGYFTVFEFNRIPHSLVEQLQEEAEIVFTPSQFSKNAMVNTGVKAKKIFIAHHPFISNPPNWEQAPPFKLPEVKESFKFLSVFEWVARKRPDIMIKAFTQEFDKDESVALVMRCWGQGHGSLARQINNFAKNDKRIYWLKQHATNMASLYRSADAYVSTPAGEGFGCTFAEAMACFPASQEVITESGSRQISSIIKDDFVLTHTSSFKRVVNTSARVFAGEGCQIERYYDIPFVCTPEHPILTEDGFKQAKDVKLSDWIAVKTVETPKKRSVKYPIIPIKGRKWWFIGLYLAEGCLDRSVNEMLKRKSGGIVLSVHAKEKDEILNKLNGISIRTPNSNQFLYRAWISLRPKCRVKQNKCRIDIYSINLARFFMKFGKNATEKAVPQDVFDFLRTDDRARKFFLDGLLYGDGYVHDSQKTLEMVSKKLLLQVKELLELEGIFARMSQTKNAGKALIKGVEYNIHDTWRLRWTSSQKYVKKTRKYYYIKVKSVGTKQLNELVYNLEVEDDHTYTLPQAIVHNCGIPTIGPRHSGNLEFMNDNNSWLCEVGPWEIVGNVESIYWVRPNMKWRVPEIESVQEQMRAVYEEFKGLTQQERLEHPKVEEALTLKDTLSLEIVGEQMKKGIEWWADNFAE